VERFFLEHDSSQNLLKSLFPGTQIAEDEGIALDDFAEGEILRVREKMGAVEGQGVEFAVFPAAMGSTPGGEIVEKGPASSSRPAKLGSRTLESITDDRRSEIAAAWNSSG